MPGLETGTRIDLYQASDSDEAMQLEARSPQGKAFRLRFDRSYFHRRAENFDCWRLVTARSAGALVGIAGAALKAATFEGRQTTAVYLFDARVAPEVRRSRVAQQLLQELIDWARGKAEIGYGYIAGDNEAAARLAQQWIGAAAAPACRYLVYPVYKAGDSDCDVRAASAESVHQAFVDQGGPFGLYCPPHQAFSVDAYVGSWRYARGTSSAACSAWSNEKIMAEVVEGVPLSLAAAGAVLRSWPINRLRMPHLPKRGERVRSWYLFDFHASDGHSAAALINGVAAEAKRRGIDYCYIIHRGGEAWVDAVRRQVPRLFAPVIPYSIMARMIDDGTPIRVHAPYIDIRDV